MDKIKKIFLSQTVKDTTISFVGLGFSALVGFVYTVILARQFGPEKFGIFSAITAFIAIVYSLGDLGITSSLINFIPKFKEKRSQFINTSFVFELFIASLIIIIFTIFSFFSHRVIPGSTQNQILLASVLTLNYFFIGYVQGIFTAERKFWLYSTSQIIDAGIKIILIFTILTFSRITIELAILANIISTIIAIIVSYLKASISLRFNFDKDIFAKLYSFAKWVAVTRVFSVFISRIDVVLLNLLSTSYQAGIYAAASRITLFFSLLIASLGSIVNPRFSGFDNKDKVASYMKKLFLLVTAISASMLILVLFAKPIIMLVFGDKYTDSISVFQWLTVAMIPFIYTLITTPALMYSFNKPSFIAKLTIVQVLVIIAIELIFIPVLGPHTPAIALGVSNSLILIISLLRIRKIYLIDEKI